MQIFSIKNSKNFIKRREGETRTHKKQTIKSGCVHTNHTNFPHIEMHNLNAKVIHYFYIYNRFNKKLIF